MADWITANQPKVHYSEILFNTSSIRADAHSATRHVQIATTDELDFTKSILGYTTLNVDGTLNRFPPAYHPDFPWLYAKSLDFVQAQGNPTRPDVVVQEFAVPGIGQQTGMYSAKELSVEYTWPEDGVIYKPNFLNPAASNELWRYVGRKVEYDVVAQPLPLKQLIFKSDGTNIPTAGTIIIPSATIYYQWFQIPATFTLTDRPLLPGNLETSIASVVGTTNNASFDGYPAATLLCLAPKRTLLPQSDGSIVFNLTYTFAQRGLQDLSVQDAAGTDTSTPNWNRVARANGTFGYVVVNTAGNPTLYSSSDFTKLFKFT